MSAEIYQFIPRPNPNRSIKINEPDPIEVMALEIMSQVFPEGLECSEPEKDAS